MRVLIADDSRSSRAFLARLLVGWGYEVIECANGDEAWSLLREPTGPPLAILDWVMPGMDGVEVCRRLRAEQTDRHAFVYLLTARDREQDVLDGLDAGADDYLTKPFKPAELRIRLRNGQRVVQLHDALIATREALREQAYLDPLTSLANRRAFLEMADKELSRAARRATSLVLLMIDLDHFKGINDTLGHPAGDRVLVEAAARLKGVVRQSDHLARWGGEEMVALLPDCAPRDAVLVAERLRRSISRTPIVTASGAVTVTASIGLAVTLDGAETLPSLIGRADQALYAAKAAGRDRTILAPANAIERLVDAERAGA